MKSNIMSNLLYMVPTTAAQYSTLKQVQASFSNSVLYQKEIHNFIIPYPMGTQISPEAHTDDQVQLLLRKAPCYLSGKAYSFSHAPAPKISPSIFYFLRRKREIQDFKRPVTSKINLTPLILEEIFLSKRSGSETCQHCNHFL